MKLIVRKGIVEIANTHDLLRRSLLRFIARKKRSIFTYQNAPISDSEFDSEMHLTFSSSEYKVKDIKPLVSELKSEWRLSDSYKNTGFAKSELRDRGWTDAAITKFLGECDCKVKNPHYSSGSPMQIYNVSRVLKAESGDKWQMWYESSLEKRAKLSKASYERAEKERASLLKQVYSIRLNIPSFNKNKLFDNAIEHYNELAFDMDKPFVYLSNCNTEFLHRVTVNYLRHEFNDYEERLERMARCVGNRQAYVLLKTRILEHIAEKYPFLRGAVNAQKARLVNSY